MEGLQCVLRDLSTPTPQTARTSTTAFLSLLDTITDARKLRQIHAHMIISGIIKDPFAASQLLSSPALVESDYARLIFTQIPSPNLFSWNTMIWKLADNDAGSINPALLVYKEMLGTDARPDGHTFLYLIRALAARLDLQQGQQIHSNIVKAGFGTNQFVSSSLVGFYAACGFVDRGHQVFDEVPQPGLVLWTAIMRAYVCEKNPQEALRLFGKMRGLDLMPDAVALATIVSACSQLGNLDMARALHGFISKSGINMDAFLCSGFLGMYGESGSIDFAHRLFCEMPMKNVVVWNTMIHQYVKCDNIDLAYQLFKIMPNPDVVSWNTMVGGLSSVGRCKDALTLFHQMESSGVKPNKLTLLITLSACASLGALDTGTWIHAYLEKNRLNSESTLDPGLIDMYSKCGSIDKALQVFEKIPRRDLFSWTSIICGLAMHGHSKQALHHFHQMQEAKVQPDDVTMVGVLNACAHAGLVEEGWKLFHSMKEIYKLTPKIEHYGCMIDLLGRMGCLQGAYNLIIEMPMEPNAIIWAALLSACKVHNNVEFGEIASKRLLELDPSDPWARVMLSNMYAEASKWEAVMRLRKEIKESGMRKAPGCSLIEVNGTVHEFLVGDNSHTMQAEIHSILEKMEIMLKLG
ncbi:pentatricopeptide repeat-containing protein At2g29760, chloroplastic-like [Macadamia integrifolia]|uniref:pentatricopeptide repeat-containing protein At2g29760, chloroplastic-like n=1 Tax=Macadamia integrifolia TaxID=60698 RepID=UPI001C529B21|nr:pentatricopeptide repeat-containing protein At2g29760, chloroplastic-like [Macadamia integrifolia]